MIVRLEDLRRRATERGNRDEELSPEFVAALLKAAPALIAAARAVAEGGPWACERSRRRACGTCIYCQLNAARDKLAKVDV